MAKQFVVIGLGTFGMTVAKTLANYNQQVLALDKNEEVIKDISGYVTHAITMDATDEDAMKKLDVDKMQAAIVGVGNIQDNILISLLLKELKVPTIIAKSVNAQHRKVLEKIGVTHIISPEEEVGKSVAERLTATKFFDFIHTTGKYRIAEVIAPPKWTNKTIGELDIRTKYGVYVVGIKRKFLHIDEKGETTTLEDLIVAPTADVDIKKGDSLIVLGEKENIDKL